MYNPKRSQLCLLSALLFCLFSGLIHAAPVNGGLDMLKQPDGTLVSVRIWGDEYYQHVESLDGRTLVRDSVTGEICYAELSDDGEELISTGQRYAGTSQRSVRQMEMSQRGFANPVRLTKKAMQRIAGKNKGLLEPRQAAVSGAPEAITSQGETIMPAASIFSPSNPLIGSYKGLTLLIDFSDQHASISQAQINNYCNQIGYSGYSNNGSVRDYFKDISGGKLDYTNHVTAYYRAANPKDYYEDRNVSYGKRARELIREALNHLENNVGFDFSTLSTSGTKVLAVNAFYAGYAASGWSKGLWPHKGGGLNFHADGVSCSTYQITDIENSLKLRTFCHENGHMLCYYPDLYDYGGQSRGVGNYCLMAYGANDKNPVPPNAYFRYTNGWETMTGLNDVYGVVSHSLTSNSNNSYFYLNQSNPNELLVMESRRKTDRNAKLPDEGMMIWHIDRNGSNNNEQMTPSSHYLVSLEQADGNFDLEKNRNSGDTYDLFHAAYRNKFDDFTTPGANWWSGVDSGLVIRNVGHVASTMTFETHNTGIIMSFETPVNNELLIEGDDVYVKVNASDINGSVSSVKLYFNGAFVRQENGSPYEWGADGQNDTLLQNLTAGFHTLKAVAADNDGMTKETSVMIEVLGPTVVDLSAAAYKYDLGARDSVVMDGWSLLFPEMYGDISWSDKPNTADRGTGSGANNVNRDFVYKSTPVTLNHKLANGLWAVTINMGDADYPHDNMVVAAEGLVYHSDVDAAAGEYPYANFYVVVDDGELNIEISDAGGTDNNWVWTRLSLTYKGSAPATDMIDFAGLASAWLETDPGSHLIFSENFEGLNTGDLNGQAGWHRIYGDKSTIVTNIAPVTGSKSLINGGDNSGCAKPMSITVDPQTETGPLYMSALVKWDGVNSGATLTIGMSEGGNSNKFEVRFSAADIIYGYMRGPGYLPSINHGGIVIDTRYLAVVKIEENEADSAMLDFTAKFFDISGGLLGPEDFAGAWVYTVARTALNNKGTFYKPDETFIGINAAGMAVDDFQIATEWAALEACVEGQFQGSWQHAEKDYNNDGVIDSGDLMHVVDRWLQ